MHPTDRLLTPGEVAELFRVGPKTVTRWAAEGKLNSIRTPGRHRRFAESQVRALLEGTLGGNPAVTDPPTAGVPRPDPATTPPAVTDPPAAGPTTPPPGSTGSGPVTASSSAEPDKPD